MHLCRRTRGNQTLWYWRHPRERKREKPDWRLTIRFRHGEDDDLIKYLTALPIGRRAGIVREAVRQAVQMGMTYDGHWSQGPHRDMPDMRVTVRFHHGEDDQAIAFLQSLPSRKRSAFIRQALRARLEVAALTRVDYLVSLSDTPEEVGQEHGG